MTKNNNKRHYKKNKKDLSKGKNFVPRVVYHKPLWKKTWGILATTVTALLTIFGLIGGFDWICNKSKTTHEKFAESFIFEGTINAIPMQKAEQYIMDVGAKSSYPSNTLEENKDFIGFGGFGCGNPYIPHVHPHSDKEATELPMDLRVRVSRGYLYLSVTVKDLRTKAIIARLEDNKWLIRPYNITDYYSDSRAFEVLDSYGNVAFQLSYDSCNIIKIRGYFVGEWCTLFLHDDGLKMLFGNELNFEYYRTKYAVSVKPKFCKKII